MAMGIAGAGNSGTALATFFGPRLAAVWGWHAVFGLALIPLLATFTFFLICAKDSPNHSAFRPLRSYGEVLKLGDTWWFCLLYSITFGGFVGLASFLNIFFLSQYGLSSVQAGGFATLCVLAGSVLRPLGGYLADRIGGVRMLTALYLAAGSALLGLAMLPPLGAGTILLFAAMAALGMGNGAVFQLVPQRFPKEIGVTTGIVGAAGGLGGFVLPTVLGGLKQATGSFSGGFLAFALVGGLGGALSLAYASRGWRGIFIGEGGRAAKVAGASLELRAEVSGVA
jgi:NNP family nitrate/nitrite transporter-like MFS transporter